MGYKTEFSIKQNAKEGIISISETKRNHIGQDLGNTGGDAEQLLFLSSKNAVTIAEARAGTLPCRRRICLKPVTGRRFC